MIIEKRILVGKFSSNNKIYDEEFEEDYYENAFETYKIIISHFNEKELDRAKECDTYHPDIRLAISAFWKDEKIIYCDFEKTNCGTLKDNKGYYDRVKCRICGKVKKRRTIDGSDIILVCGKNESLGGKKIVNKRVKKSWCNNCSSYIQYCICDKKDRDWT